MPFTKIAFGRSREGEAIEVSSPGLLIVCANSFSHMAKRMTYSKGELLEDY